MDDEQEEEQGVVEDEVVVVMQMWVWIRRTWGIVGMAVMPMSSINIVGNAISNYLRRDELVDMIKLIIKIKNRIITNTITMIIVYYLHMLVLVVGIHDDVVSFSSLLKA